MTAEQAAQSLILAWNCHDAPSVAALFSAACKSHDVAEAAPRVGPAGVAEACGRLFRAIPDLKIEPREVVSAGHVTAVFWTMCGTHLGSFMRIPPTGRAFSVEGSWLLTVRGRRIVHIRSVWDVAGLLRAVGLLPDLQAAEP